MKVSGVAVEDAGEAGVDAAKTVADVVTEVVTTGETTTPALPISHVCSGEKFGGEQGKLLRKPSGLKVKHWFPGPTPLLTAFRTSGKPILPERLVVELKKNC